MFFAKRDLKWEIGGRRVVRKKMAKKRINQRRINQKNQKS
jgi:hypothetical protein